MISQEQFYETWCEVRAAYEEFAATRPSFGASKSVEDAWRKQRSDLEMRVSAVIQAWFVLHKKNITDANDDARWLEVVKLPDGQYAYRQSNKIFYVRPWNSSWMKTGIEVKYAP